MRIKARYVAVFAGALAAMALPGTAHAIDGEAHHGAGYLKNVGLDGCLTAVYDSADGAIVRVKPCQDGDLRQIWFTTSPSVDPGEPAVTIRKNAGECLQLIGDDLPWNGRLALRDCDEDQPYQVFRTTTADWDRPTWHVTSLTSGGLLRAYHEHEAPYVSQTKEWPGAFAEWEHVPVGR
jgi:hypothetical protein